MADLQGRKVFKVFNQDFIVDERYTVTKELGQGAYGIVWCVCLPPVADLRITPPWLRGASPHPRPRKATHEAQNTRMLISCSWQCRR